MTKENEGWSAKGQAVFVPNYKQAPLLIERGEGSYVWDAEGRRYLDLVAGIAVSALGHQHPAVLQAIQAQSARVLHTSNLYWNRPSIELAERLVAHSFAERVFFCNSGAEANEALIKLARRRAYLKGERDRTEIVSFEQSFHGRTFGALAATGQPKYHEGFQPLPAGFMHLPYGDVGALRRAVGPRTAAILVEPIQGEGGVRPAPPGFLAACAEIAHGAGALLCLDEVQTGIGRTGKLFAHEWEGVQPDALSVAKALGGGLPIGAVLATAEAASAFTVGSHGTTFGGNALSCAVGAAVLDVVLAPGFLERVTAVGEQLARGLAKLRAEEPTLVEVRGRGLLLGLVLADGARFEAKDVVEACRARGVLVHVAGPRVVRLVPPLTLGPAEVELALAVLREALVALR